MTINQTQVKATTPVQRHLKVIEVYNRISTQFWRKDIFTSVFPKLYGNLKSENFVDIMLIYYIMYYILYYNINAAFRIFSMTILK